MHVTLVLLLTLQAEISGLDFSAWRWTIRSRMARNRNPQPRRSLCNSATETRTNLNTALVFDILKGLEKTGHKTDLGLLLILTDSEARSIIYTHQPQQQTAVVLTSGSSSTLTSSSSSTRKISYSAPLLREWSLITGRGGGGYKMGKSLVQNLLCPPTTMTRTSSSRVKTTPKLLCPPCSMAKKNSAPLFEGIKLHLPPPPPPFCFVTPLGPSPQLVTSP